MTFARVSPEIRIPDSANGDSIPVIVHIAAPDGTMTALSPHTTAADRSRSEAIALLLGDATGRLTAAVSRTDLDHVRPFKLQPAFAAVVTGAGLDGLLADPAVSYIEPDRRYRPHTQEGLEMIGAFDLHNLGFSGAGTAVAIIDTGIDYHHPTLGGATIPNAKVVRGLDTADLDDDPMDCGGHGTAVASVAAGTSYQWNPQLRFAGGVAPQAKIFAYKASPDSDCGVFAQSAVIAAIEDAVLHRIGDDYQLAAINLSLGSGAFQGPCDGLVSSWASAVSAATQGGVAVVASAGNEGSATALSAPACMAEVISVGSVWDTEPGLVSFSFCLDPECTAVCNDSFRPAGSVTCYSNAGSVLDVFAPSEFLRAARAGDETVEFGGTSGAAAYVTGSVAVIRQAAPMLTPAGARRLLQMTGVPTLDQRSGMLRPRIHLARALELAEGIHASDGPPVDIPDVAETPALSTLQVSGEGRVGSVRVLLNVAHPDPEELRIVLSSPDGTSVRLHDRAAGTVGGGDGASPAVWGVFPDEIEPVDSFGLFGGRELAGTWTLEVVDEVPGNGGSTPASIVGWALRIERAEPPDQGAVEVVTIPVAAKTAGARGTLWVSDLRMLNPSEERTAVGRLYLVASPGDGEPEFRQTELLLPPRTVVDLPDVVSRRFAADGVRGALRLQVDLPGVIATSRIFTLDEGGGSYGQYVGAASPHETAAVGDAPLALLHLFETSSFRTNVGFTEISGQQATVELGVYNGDAGGAAVGISRHVVEPFSNLQVRVGSGASADNLYALVRTVDGPGRIVAYASTVDNRTGDAILIPAIRPEPVGQLVLPVVARTLGQIDTDWRTELRIANLGDHPAVLNFEFKPRREDPGEPATVSRTVAPGTVLALGDAMEELFGAFHGVGSLRLTVPDGQAEIAATARIFNSTQVGTYGQFVAFAGGSMGRSAAVIHADSSSTTRTNLGICEVDGGTVTVRATVRDTYGRPLGDPYLLTADPYQLVQVDDVFAAVGQASAANAWIELEIVAGDGGFVGYGSMVDATTGDAIFVPSRPLPESPPPFPWP